ncbi:MAG: hypothetical protein ACE5G1_12785, partial [bacterium]
MSGQTMKRWLNALFLITITIGCQACNPKKSKEFSNIVFLSNRDAPKRQFDIFIMNRDGSHQENLTKELHSIRS